MNKRLTILALCTWSAAWAHPMGNFSVSHYTKLQTTARGVEVEYALDLAEIPTFQLLREWKLDRGGPRAALDQRADKQAREWLRHLRFIVNGKRSAALFDSAQLVIADGAGNLPILRITTRAIVPAQGGRLQYQDENYPGRAGWKEIVIGTGRDISHGLTQYPSDPTVAPPQDLRAELKLRNAEPVVAASAPAPLPPPAPAPIATRAAPSQPGSVVRGDFLSKLLHEDNISPWMILIALLTAFGLGAAHALTPGHGKTIVAAYLVGSRGTLKHAAFLGAMVTFTHTVAVFALGIAVLFLFQYVVPEKVTAWLGAISGLTIVAMGGWMFYKRFRHARAHAHAHAHHHHHHEHEHHHHHDHHHEHSHTHMPEKLSWRALAVLGASGGLVPCESALVLLLGAIALGRTGFGLILLAAFSLGLAVVLMAIGALVLYAKNLLPVRKTGGPAFFRWVSIASPAVVTIAGLVTTAVSLGWIPAA
jgi:ABC-type nickel/cobalt efflux system permease component RcnA